MDDSITRFRPNSASCIAFLSNHNNEELAQAQPKVYRTFLGACEKAKSYGFECRLIFAGPRALNGSELRRHLQILGCHCLILGAINPQFGIIDLDWSQFSLVKFESDFVSVPCPMVATNQIQGLRLAFTKIKERGYRRVGLVLEESAAMDPTRSHPERGLRSLVSRLHPSIPHYQLLDDEGAARHIPSFQEWLGRHSIDLVLTNSIKLPGLAALSGLKIPEDVACAWIPLSETNPLCAGISYKYHDMGARAVDILSPSMRPSSGTNTNTQLECFIPPLWNDGSSAPILARTNREFTLKNTDSGSHAA